MGIWKDIPGYEGLYQVSNMGQIKSFPRTNRSTSKILSTKPKDNGYIEVALYKNKKCIKFYIHRIVLETFIGKSDLECNHKDGIKSHNNIENLEYCTRTENLKHAFKIGLKEHKGVKHPRSKLREFQIYRIKFIAKYYNVKRGYWTSLARSLRMSRSAIYSIIKNVTWKHIHV